MLIFDKTLPIKVVRGLQDHYLLSLRGQKQASDGLCFYMQMKQGGFYKLYMYAHDWLNLSKHSGSQDRLSSLRGQNKLLMDSAFTCKWSQVGI